MTGGEAGDDDNVIRELENKINDIEGSIAAIKQMMAGERGKFVMKFQELIRLKELELVDARKKKASLDTVPKVKRYSPFTGDRRARGMAAIQAARKIVHDFAAEENVDPTAMQTLLHASLSTSLKTSAWDCFQHILSILRAGGGAHLTVFLFCYLLHSCPCF